MSGAQQLTVGDTWASAVNDILQTNNVTNQFVPQPPTSDPSGTYSKQIAGVHKVTAQQLVALATTLKLDLNNVEVVGDAKVGFALRLTKKREPAWLQYIRNRPILFISAVVLLFALVPLFLFWPAALPASATQAAGRPDAAPARKHQPHVDPLQIVIPN